MLDIMDIIAYRRFTMNRHGMTTTRQGTEQAEGLTPEDLARGLKALAHPARLAIVRALRRSEGCFCGRLVDLLPLAQSTVSEHVRKLVEAGIVIGREDGGRVCYCVDETAMARLKKAVELL